MIFPYIGVTGYMSRNEIKETLTVVPHTTYRKLMVGVLASSKTMQGIENKWPNRYPIPVEKIKNIFVNDPRTLNLVHYNSKELDTLYQQMIYLTTIAGPFFNGFQLNIKWPDKNVLQRYRTNYPEKTIVLQCGHSAIESSGGDPITFAKKVKEYELLADYVLFDPSGGLGKPFDPYTAQEYLWALREAEVQMGFGVAGGLSAETLHLVKHLIEDFPNISIDAEGQLRDKPSDILNTEKTRAYIRGAFELFK